MGEKDHDGGHTRRAVLAGLAVSGGTAAYASDIVAAAVQRHSAVADYAALEMSMRGLLFNKGVARSVNTNRDRTTDVEVTRADGPDGSRQNVLQITSDGDVTPDYGFSVANVRSRQLTLDDLSNKETTYEYRGGTPNTSAVPDEVWIVLKPRRGKRGKRRHLLRTEVDDSLDGWEKRTVSAEISGDLDRGISGAGSGQPWKEFLPDKKELREVGMDLIEKYGRNASVHGVGVGRGSPVTSPSRINTYFDNLVVAGQSTELPR